MNHRMDKPIEKWKKDELIDFIGKHKEAIESTQASIKKIESFVDEHAQTLEDLPSKLEQAQQQSAELDELNQKAVEAKQEIDGMREDVENKQEEIESFYSDLLQGEEATEEAPKRVPSIKEQISNFQESSEKQFAKLKARIEGLLPGATSAGLASSYQDAQKEKKAMPLWIGFIASLLVLMAGYFYSFVYNSPPTDLSTIAIRATIGFPLIWIAWFCQRSISQMTRISEEYRHKEKMMRIYDGFSKQIEQSTDAEEGKTKKMDLISVTINAIEKNPAEKLDPSETFIDSWGKKKVEIKSGQK
ncbi:MAG: hypothetical protein OXI86_22265 [Candidatus Poribacteria bacterium]|nr:hypothetical protein [Candidatus Poribacteria bacterium]